MAVVGVTSGLDSANIPVLQGNYREICGFSLFSAFKSVNMP
jgi:hypothetical protein